MNRRSVKAARHGPEDNQFQKARVAHRMKTKKRWRLEFYLRKTKNIPRVILFTNFELESILKKFVFCRSNFFQQETEQKCFFRA